MNEWDLGDFKMKFGETDESYSIVSLLNDLHKKYIQLNEKYNLLQDDIRRLEYENIELTNSLYEVSNSLEARIDILGLEILKDKEWKDPYAEDMIRAGYRMVDGVWTLPGQM